MFQSPLSRGTTPDIKTNANGSQAHKFQSPLSRGTTPDEEQKEEFSFEKASFNPL